MVKKNMNWKLFFILLGMCTFGTLAVLPYTLTLQWGLIQNSSVPLYVILTGQIIQSTFLFIAAIFIGLYIYKKVDLSIPLLNGWLEGKPVGAYLKSILGISMGLGVVAGILIIIMDILFASGMNLNSALIAQSPPPPWQGFLAGFYGGINEEVLLRLFLMSLLAWIFFKIKKSDAGKPTKVGMWLAIILAALIFGVGHLPAVMSMTALTPLIIVRTIVLNSVGGIIFGWLYWKKGLESAMISHFSADMILHVIFPAILLAMV